MRHKLFNKYFLATAAIVILSITFIIMILSFTYNKYIVDEKYKSLDKACTSVTDFVEAAANDSLINSPERGLYYVISNIAEVTDFDIFVTDRLGVIKVCSCAQYGTEGSCEHTGIRISEEHLDDSSKENRSLGTIGIYRNPHYIVASSLVNSEKQVGFVVAAASSDGIHQIISRIIRLSAFSSIGPLLVMSLALYGINYRLTKPLKLMSEAARAMARGDFSRRIPVTSDDEIGELAVSFNQMTNSLVRLEETRKDFIANVSHELKTPMTTIAGFIDGIIDGTIEQEKSKHYLEIVSGEIKRLSRMVQSMLSLARLESGEFTLKTEQFDFRELVLSVVISQEQRIEQKKINVNGLDELPSVSLNADKDMIYRVIYNLVDNAVKFTDENGTISFKVRADSKKLVFRIQNTGKGIPKNDLPYVFERFYKVDKSRSANKNSTGLGLYIVKTIVKNHGGSISVSSAENEFTAFEVTLPIKK